MSRRVILFGAGGQAREQAWVARSLHHQVVGFAVTDASNLGPHHSSDLVVGDIEWLDANRDRFDALSIAIGTPTARLRVAAMLAAQGYGSEWFLPLIHPSVPYDAESCNIGPGVYVGPGAVLTVNVVLEAHAMVNFGATVGHEARIGRGCVINPGANISGGVVLGEGVLVGTGAQILQYHQVGAGATIGAGAVVTSDVRAGATVVGVPAKERG
jgi:sugar O-acyltransferase (sialic acid O-acetyltransferase NeuD family)